MCKRRLPDTCLSLSVFLCERSYEIAIFVIGENSLSSSMAREGSQKLIFAKIAREGGKEGNGMEGEIVTRLRGGVDSNGSRSSTPLSPYF